MRSLGAHSYPQVPGLHRTSWRFPETERFSVQAVVRNTVNHCSGPDSSLGTGPAGSFDRLVRRVQL